MQVISALCSLELKHVSMYKYYGTLCEAGSYSFLCMCMCVCACVCVCALQCSKPCGAGSYSCPQGATSDYCMECKDANYSKCLSYVSLRVWVSTCNLKLCSLAVLHACLTSYATWSYAAWSYEAWSYAAWSYAAWSYAAWSYACHVACLPHHSLCCIHTFTCTCKINLFHPCCQASPWKAG